MTGEQEVLAAIMARLDALLIACAEDETALGGIPGDMVAFAAMPPSRRVASRALLKTVEQLEDQLARLFRLLPKLMLEDSAGWHVQDYANFAEKLGILDDGLGWSAIVRLRNRLVHDYPLVPGAQLEMLKSAHDAVPILRAAVLAARRFTVQRGFA